MADEIEDQALTSIATALAGCPHAEFKDRLRRSLERNITMLTTVAETRPAVSGGRPGFTAVTPFLVAPDIEPVITFAKRVFDAKETGRSPHGTDGTHCELQIGDSMLMLFGGSGKRVESAAPALMGLHIYVDDVDAAFARALEAGGQSLGEPEDRPYGERAGFIKDAAGNHWYIATLFPSTYHKQPPATVTPHLYVQRTETKGAPEFLEFVQAAFGAELEFRVDTPAGLVGHAVLRLRGSAIAVGEGHEPGFPAPATFYLYVDDCDALYERAIQAGATSSVPVEDRAYGDRMGGVVDPWGNGWLIATHQAKA
jgi:PhnB protein